MNLIRHAVNPDNGIDDTTHAAHGAQDHGIAAGFIVFAVGKKKLGTRNSVRKPQVKKTCSSLSIRKNTDLRLFECSNQQIQSLAAAAPISLKQFARKGDLKKRLTLLLIQLERSETLNKACLATRKSQSFANIIAQAAIVEHPHEKPLRQNPAKATPRLRDKDLLFLLILCNALEYALTTKVKILANVAIRNLAILVSFNGSGREQDFEVAADPLCGKSLLRTILVNNDEMSQTLIRTAELRGDVGTSRTLLVREIGTITD